MNQKLLELLDAQEQSFALRITVDKRNGVTLTTFWVEGTMIEVTNIDGNVAFGDTSLVHDESLPAIKSIAAAFGLETLFSPETYLLSFNLLNS